MKTHRTSLLKMIALIYLALVSLGSSKQQSPLPFGAPIPKPGLKLKDVSGKLISLQDVKTPDGLLVIFSSNTCSYVLKNKKRTLAICQYAMQKNIGVILLNPNEGSRNSEDSFGAMQAYAASQGFRWPYAIDSNHELADAIGATHIPGAFMFNGRGLLVYYGAIDDSPADETKVQRRHLKEAIDEMTNNKEITIKSSRVLGCSLKRNN